GGRGGGRYGARLGNRQVRPARGPMVEPARPNGAAPRHEPGAHGVDHRTFGPCPPPRPRRDPAARRAQGAGCGLRRRLGERSAGPRGRRRHRARRGRRGDRRRPDARGKSRPPHRLPGRHAGIAAGGGRERLRRGAGAGSDRARRRPRRLLPPPRRPAEAERAPLPVHPEPHRAQPAGGENRRRIRAAPAARRHARLAHVRPPRGTGCRPAWRRPKGFRPRRFVVRRPTRPLAHQPRPGRELHRHGRARL
ncbi:MAG: 3-demethylubiquinol 3-O-methyltransferase @ 2-polyprenyl-6-hydroxyphenyl methylase, partial [uncultured Acetobacteraceae bacterium]